MARKIRHFVQVLSLAVFFWLITHKLQQRWLMIFLVSLPLSVLLGRIYCGWICPINTVMIPTHYVAKKLGVKHKEPPSWAKSGTWKWLVLVASVTIMVAGRKIGLKVNIMVLLIAIGAISTLFYKPELWHKYLCPYGALQSLTGRFARFTQRVDHSACNGCRLCQRACPAGAITIDQRKATIDPALCLVCLDCTPTCRTKAISYGSRTTDSNHSVGVAG